MRVLKIRRQLDAMRCCTAPHRQGIFTSHVRSVRQKRRSICIPSLNALKGEDFNAENSARVANAAERERGGGVGRGHALLHGPALHAPRLSSEDVFQETSARYDTCRAVEPSSGSNVIPRRARPGLARLRSHSVNSTQCAAARHRAARASPLVAAPAIAPADDEERETSEDYHKLTLRDLNDMLSIEFSNFTSKLCFKITDTHKE